jgi:hypothetical protein
VLLLLTDLRAMRKGILAISLSIDCSRPWFLVRQPGPRPGGHSQNRKLKCIYADEKLEDAVIAPASLHTTERELQFFRRSG